MRLSPPAFNALIGHLGQQVLHRVAVMCPCRDPYSGAAKTDCPTCQGRGVFWRRGQTAHLALTSLKQAREFRDYGLIETGDVVLTLPSNSPAYWAAENDVFLLVQSDQPWTGIYIRGAATERWPPGVFSVIDITGLDGNQEPVAFAAPGLPPLETGGAPVWPADNAPAPGQQYTVRARQRPAYYLLRELPQSRHHHGGADLPRRVAARALDLFGRGAP